MYIKANEWCAICKGYALQDHKHEMDGNQIAAMIEGSRITSSPATRTEQQTVSNEEAYLIIEHAIDYLSTRGYPDDSVLVAIDTLYEAHKGIGPLGQIPSWERI